MIKINKNELLRAEREDISFLFPPLKKRMNKGDAGRVLCICGSYDPCGSAMCGAAYFSAAAAYKCGAGIVELFTHRKNYEALASLVPEAVFTLYDTEKENAEIICERLKAQIKKADSIVLGCGLGKSELAREMVKTVLEISVCPLVIDADGINILAESEKLQALVQRRKADTVLTPHPGEKARLIGRPIPEILANTVQSARSTALKLGVTVLLKDHNTVITDGTYTFRNHTGNPGMATAGMGDILSGIIGALLARSTVSEHISPERFDLPFTLYRTAVATYLHGLAGDLACERVGEYSLTATELLNLLPEAIKNNR